MRKSKRLLVLAMETTLAVGMTTYGSKEAAPRTTAAAAQDSQAKDSQEDRSRDSAPAGKEATSTVLGTMYSWKWGAADSTSNPSYEAMEYFYTLLDEKASRKWSIQIHPGSQLGDASQLCESIQVGTLEMACPASPIVAGYVSDYNVFDMPHLLATVEEVNAALDDKVGTELTVLTNNADMKLVAWWEIGSRYLANDARSINSMEDIRELRPRAMGNEVHQALQTTFGASSVPMSLPDAYVANQNGTTGGQDNPLHSLIANSAFKVYHYIAIANHVCSPLGVIASPRTQTLMSPEDQELFIGCIKKTTANQRKLVREQNREAAKEPEEKGCEMTCPQLQPFASRMGMVYEQYFQFSAWLDKIKWGRCSMYNIYNMYNRGNISGCVGMWRKELWIGENHK